MVGISVDSRGVTAERKETPEKASTGGDLAAFGSLTPRPLNERVPID